MRKQVDRFGRILLKLSLSSIFEARDRGPLLNRRGFIWQMLGWATSHVIHGNHSRSFIHVKQSRRARTKGVLHLIVLSTISPLNDRLEHKQTFRKIRLSVVKAGSVQSTVQSPGAISHWRVRRGIHFNFLISIFKQPKPNFCWRWSSTPLHYGSWYSCGPIYTLAKIWHKCTSRIISSSGTNQMNLSFSGKPSENIRLVFSKLDFLPRKIMKFWLFEQKWRTLIVERLSTMFGNFTIKGFAANNLSLYYDSQNS